MKGKTMKTYRSGRNRVHHSHPVEEIKAAIAEYTEFAAKHPNDPLSRDLIKCVVDLREELTLRGIAPETCPECKGSGVYHYVYKGEVRSDRCPKCALAPDDVTATAFETVKGRTT
jgi:hypothetical protein